MLAVRTVDMPRLAMRGGMIVVVIMPMMMVVMIVPVVVPVVVPMIMAVIVAAAAFIAMLVMMMRLGIDQRRRELAFERNRHLARAVLVLDQQRHDFGTETEIIDRTEIMPAQATLPVEKQNRRRTLQLVSLHRLGQLFAVRLVERDGDSDAVLGQISFDLLRRLLGKPFERHVQPEHRDFALLEGAAQPHRLRQAELRTGATQLPDRDDDDFAFLGLERALLVGGGRRSQ